ncbi:FecCD family ABC transporter permease [Ferranicluibacter rubi]|uniref:Iron ABC transporter permease n=1 Tax=Ferranicluibacter rubi TaxID=2715133 RepID=A0AA43ZIC4_9HYPH|nr:iron ABC transporter permease [Ferranicluibacter rubi]TCP74712.1 iron complex transport system permease protein [Rhizobium sp. PP-CC-2G-626]TCQ25788.1 iron complex transport system permease protein [Rhizobium sp. PP-CC-3G-465]
MRSVLVLLGMTAVMLFVALAIGDHPVALAQIIAVLTDSPVADLQSIQIVRDIRLPRVIMGFLVGASLAIAGMIAQSVLRNPLAEPGLIGVNAGAALAAVIVIVKFEVPPTHLLSWLAFAGALTMSLAIYALSWNSGSSSLRIILIGIGLSSLAWAGANFISAFGDPQAVQRAMIWLSGSVYNSTWEKIRTLVIWLAIGMAGSGLIAREMDLLALGDETARARGQPVELLRAVMFVLCAVLSGAAVAAAGLVAFVGLIAPHVARLLVGHSHGLMLPVTALAGGLLVVAADLAARTLFMPAQLPVGLMTAILGAPFFAYLMWRKRNV